MKHIKVWKVIAVLALTLSSCNDYLTIDDLENRSVSQGYYDAPKRVEQAVIGIYVNLRKALLVNYGWLMYGEARAGDLFVDVDYQGEVAGQQLTANQRQVIQLTDWEYFYDAIKDANDVLAILDQVDEGVLSPYQYSLFKGEALALKSLSYFYLARIWGDIPSAEAADFGQPVTESTMVERATDWARQAQGLLPWLLVNEDGIESTALTAVRFNKTAATLLLAQEELWLDNGAVAYDLLTNTFMEHTVDSLSSFGLSLGEDRRTSLPEEPLGTNTIRISLEKLNAIYPEGDARRSAMFLERTDFATLIPDDQAILNLLHTRELNLLLAESAWKAGDLDAGKAYLASAAAGATEDYTELVEEQFGDALLLERQRLLVGSGQRFFDLMRFGKVSEHIPAFSENDVQNGAAYWPLSQRSISTNGWQQNSYWSQ